MTTDASESSRRPSYSGDHVSNTLICAFCRTYALCGRSYGFAAARLRSSSLPMVELSYRLEFCRTHRPLVNSVAVHA
jgi:hypothetical protein